MGRRCFVPNCKTNYETGQSETKVSLFKAPRNAVLRAKWNEAIARTDKTLSEKDSVCELHFKKDLVIKEWSADYNGAVLMKIPSRPKLPKDAIPSVFTHKTAVTRDIPEENIEGSSSQENASDNPEYITGDLSAKTISLKRNDSLSANKKETVIKEEVGLIAEDSVKNYMYHCSITEITENSNQINSAESPDHETTNSNQITISLDPTLYHEIVSTSQPNFEEFLNIYDNLNLPSKTWAVRKHVTDYTRLVSFYDCRFSKTNHITVWKEVVVSENMELSVYVLRKSVISNVVNAEPFSINHLLEVLRLVDLLQICSGGPRKDSFPGCQPESAVLDITDVWRHRKCEIISETNLLSFQCEKCSSLFNTFRMQLKRERDRLLNNTPRCRIRTKKYIENY